jgi:serine protease SohB
LEFVADYGLFLAKSITVVIAIVVVIITIAVSGVRTRKSTRGHIEVKKVNDSIHAMEYTLVDAVLDTDQKKELAKAEKRKEKDKQKEIKKQRKQSKTDTADQGSGVRASRTYVLDFEGDVQASAVANLRQEITAVLTMAEEQDEVLLRLESPGGMVHGYGLAASQLKRIVDRKICLTVAVDKVAASGGYLMACMASKIIAAPFAILGSIGVIAQIPNFHRLLKKNEIDVDVITAGEYKRTLTVFGENTEKGRQKFTEELENVHSLFKNFVSDNRPVVDIADVSTGEAWYGTDALERKLVDELKTSDNYVSEQCKERDVFQVSYVEDKSKVDKLLERISLTISHSVEKSLLGMLQNRNLFK